MIKFTVTLSGILLHSYNPTTKLCYVNAADFYDDWTYFEEIEGCTSYIIKAPGKKP